MQDIRELQDEARYWARLQDEAERRGMPKRSDIGVGACLASVLREIATREASCGCEEHTR